jgi:hypothetical protein
MWYVHYLHAQEVMEESMRAAMRANLLRAIQNGEEVVGPPAPNELRRLAARLAIVVSVAAERAARALDSRVVASR